MIATAGVFAGWMAFNFTGTGHNSDQIGTSVLPVNQSFEINSDAKRTVGELTAKFVAGFSSSDQGKIVSSHYDAATETIELSVEVPEDRFKGISPAAIEAEYRQKNQTLCHKLKDTRSTQSGISIVLELLNRDGTRLARMAVGKRHCALQQQVSQPTPLNLPLPPKVFEPRS